MLLSLSPFPFRFRFRFFRSLSTEANDELHTLDRPLGVSQPPSTATKSWRERTTELMDHDVRLERRRHLIKESAKGYYSDFNALKRFGGKTWIAPSSLIRQEHALYFPNVSGKSLLDSAPAHTALLCQGHVSVLALLSTKMSEEHVTSLTALANAAHLAHPNYRFIQLNIQPNPAKALLVSFYLSSLRRAVPPNLHPYYILSSQNLEYVQDDLGMTNKHIGYVYLLDENLKVRWGAGGMALPGEAEALEKCAGVLLGRSK